MSEFAIYSSSRGAPQADFMSVKQDLRSTPSCLNGRRNWPSVIDLSTQALLLMDRALHNYMAMKTFFCRVNSSMPARPPSRPNPLSLTPPNGAAGVSAANPFTET